MYGLGKFSTRTEESDETMREAVQKHTKIKGWHQEEFTGLLRVSVISQENHSARCRYD